MGNFTFELVARSHKPTEGNHLVLGASQEALLFCLSDRERERESTRERKRDRQFRNKTDKTDIFLFILNEIPASSLWSYSCPCLSCVVTENEALRGSFGRVSFYVTRTWRMHKADERSLIYEKSGQVPGLLLLLAHNCQKQRASGG